MLDRHFLKVQSAILRPPATWLAVREISADNITIVGFAFGIFSAVLLAYGNNELGLAFFLINRTFDGLDGAVARVVGPTDRGAFLDIALDFFVYATIPLGFVFADPSKNALAACLLLVSFMGTASSFLAFAVVAAKRGSQSVDFPQKSIYYLGGLTEGAETIVAFTAMSLWPMYFPQIATGFAALAFITTMIRWFWGWQEFGRDIS